MKRIIAVINAFIIFAACLIPGVKLAYASGADGASGDGLYTPIPYVPKYDGELSSQSRMILMDLETGNILIEQNGDVRAYPASTTKIMTAVLLIENTKDDEWDTPVSPLEEVNSLQSAKGSQLGLMKGDQPTRRDLLYGLLLPSGCDCAYVTSCLIAGSEADFVFMMNTRASEIGMGNSGYENSYGLASNGHYTTAEDMAVLIRHAMQYPMFRSTISTPYRTLYIYNNGRTRVLGARNTNHLIHSDSPDYYPYAIGVKTGTGTLADHCLTAAARKSGLELLSIILNSDDNSERYGFTREILDWGFEYYANEGGLYSMTVTNAFFKARENGCKVYSVPETSAEDNAPVDTVPAGYGVRVGAYRYDKGGELWYMVWHGDKFLWANGEELSFISYVNDIKIESGSCLNGVIPVGTDPSVDSTVSSRHNVKVVTVTVYDSEGTPVTGGSNYPSASCTHTLGGTTVDQDVDLSILPEGLYTCVTHIEAIAFVPDAPDREYMTVEETSSILIVDGEKEHADGEPSMDDCAYSYNSNTGSDAPEGGCCDNGSQFTVSDVIPTKPGCEFAGWNTSADGSGKTYMPGDTFTPEGSFVLYAMWKAGVDSWSVDAEADATGGTVALNGSISNNAGITGASVVISDAETSLPVYENSISCLCNTLDLALITQGIEDVELESGRYDVVISASAGVGDENEVYRNELEYRTVRVYTLEFDTAGGTMASSPAVTATSGSAFGSLPVPERDGYEFTGWQLEDGTSINENTLVPDVDSDKLTLRAGWKLPGTEDDGSIHVIKKKSFLSSLPLAVWFGVGAAVVALLITLIIIILKKPSKGERAEKN